MKFSVISGRKKSDLIVMIVEYADSTRKKSKRVEFQGSSILEHEKSTL
jgi:hypothetical protein